MVFSTNFISLHVRAVEEVQQTTGEKAVNVVNPNDSEGNLNPQATSGTLTECNFRAADGKVRSNIDTAFEDCLGQIFQFVVVVAILLIFFRIALSALKAYNPLEGGSIGKEAVTIVRDIVLGLLFIGGPYLILTTLNPALTNFNITDLSGVFSNIEQGEQVQEAQRQEDAQRLQARRDAEEGTQQALIDQRLDEIEQKKEQRLVQIAEDEEQRKADAEADRVREQAEIDEALRLEQEEARRLIDEAARLEAEAEAQRKSALEAVEAQRKADEAKRAAEELARIEREAAEEEAAKEAEAARQKEEAERIEQERTQTEIDTAVDILNKYDITVNDQPVMASNVIQGIEELEERLWLYHKCHYLVLNATDTGNCYIWNLTPEYKKAQYIGAEKEFLRANLELVNEFNPELGNHERYLTGKIYAHAPVKIVEDGFANTLAGRKPKRDGSCTNFRLILQSQDNNPAAPRIDEGQSISQRTYETTVCPQSFAGTFKRTEWFSFNKATGEWVFDPLQSEFGNDLRADGTTRAEVIPNIRYAGK